MYYNHSFYFFWQMSDDEADTKQKVCEDGRRLKLFKSWQMAGDVLLDIAVDEEHEVIYLATVDPDKPVHKYSYSGDPLGHITAECGVINPRITVDTKRGRLVLCGRDHKGDRTRLVLTDLEGSQVGVVESPEFAMLFGVRYISYSDRYVVVDTETHSAHMIDPDSGTICKTVSDISYCTHQDDGEGNIVLGGGHGGAATLWTLMDTQKDTVHVYSHDGALICTIGGGGEGAEKEEDGENEEAKEETEEEEKEDEEQEVDTLVQAFGTDIDTQGRVLIADSYHDRIVRATPGQPDWEVMICTKDRGQVYPSHVCTTGDGHVIVQADKPKGTICVAVYTEYQ